MHEGKERRKRSLLFALMLIISTVVATTSVVFTFLLVQYRTKDLIDRVDSRLFTAAELTREMLGPHYHDRIVDKTSVSKEEFDRIVARNDDLCRRLNLQYLWSVLQVKDRLVFTSASHSNLKDPNSPCASFFEIHRDPASFAPVMQPGFKTSFSSFKNEWGEGRMVLIPRKDFHGRIYIFGASVQLTELKAVVRRTIITSIGVGLVVICGSFLLALLLAHSFAVPIARLTKATSRIATGDFDVPLEPAGIRELQSLSNSFDQMRQGLKRHLAELQESEEKFRLTFSASPDAVNINRLEDGLCVDINDGFTNLTGFTRKDVIGKTSLELNLWNDPADRQELVQGLREKGFYENLEAVFRRKDGSLTTALMSARIISFKGVEHIISITRDFSERKKIEEALFESQERLKEAHRLAQIGVWNWTAANDTVIWSEQLYHIAGLDINLPVPAFAEQARLFAPESWARLRSAVEKTIATGEPYQLELELIRPDGASRWVHAFGGAAYDLQGQIIGLQGALQDITERKQAEQALRENEELFRRLFTQSPVGVVIVGMDFRFQRCNEAFCRFLGYSESELTGRTFLEVTYPEDRTADAGKIQAILRSELNVAQFQKRYLRKDGKVVWGEVNIRMVQDQSGAQFLSIVQDITERRRTEEALRHERDRAQGYLDTVETIIVALNTEGRITTINRKGCQLFGCGEDELIGQLWFSSCLPQPDGMEKVYPVFLKIIAGELESLEHFENPIVTRSGELRQIAWHNASLRDEQGRIIGTLSSGDDITERKRAEEEKVKLEAQLLQAQKMESVGRLAGGVAHDFNNMLVVILGHVELAMEQVDLVPPIQAHLEEIHEAAERSANLIRQLLAFARKQMVAPEVLDLNETIAGMLKMLQRLIGENILLNWQPKADLWLVRVDPSQIDQILANLCVNARDAIADVGKITIETGNSDFDEAYCADRPGFVPGEYVRLAVSDNGCGMDKETLARIFEPFFTTKGVGEGTGLGLATVYGAVRQNNGFINAYSEPGLGTTFMIYLPRHVGKAGQARPEGAARLPKCSQETILLVEDEPTILKLTQRMLETQGYIVLTALTPGEAIRLARERGGEIHLLITDVVMPEMNGRDLAKNLLSLHPHLKCLFMSGYTANVIAHHGVLDEGVHFIQKPFSIQNLAVKVKEVLDSE